MRFMRVQNLRRAAGMLVLVLALAAMLGCNATQVSDETPPAGETDTVTYKRCEVVTVGVQRCDMSLQPYSNLSMQIARIDPAAVIFRVHYRPDDPLTLGGWVEAQPNAVLIVNAAFFDDRGRALGLLVSNGEMYGQSFEGFGGMFEVTPERVRVRSLVSEPYQGEPLVQAVQAFPVLIETGGLLARRDEGFSQRARRTWIGQDDAGRIVIGLSLVPLSFSDLQYWLLESDLNIDTAFALDGGRSSGMVINVPGHEEFYPAFDRLPSVIAVYAR